MQTKHVALKWPMNVPRSRHNRPQCFSQFNHCANCSSFFRSEPPFAKSANDCARHTIYLFSWSFSSIFFYSSASSCSCLRTSRTSARNPASKGSAKPLLVISNRTPEPRMPYVHLFTVFSSHRKMNQVKKSFMLR